MASAFTQQVLAAMRQAEEDFARSQETKHRRKTMQREEELFPLQKRAAEMEEELFPLQKRAAEMQGQLGELGIEKEKLSVEQLQEVIKQLKQKGEFFAPATEAGQPSRFDAQVAQIRQQLGPLPPHLEAALNVGILRARQAKDPMALQEAVNKIAGELETARRQEEKPEPAIQDARKYRQIIARQASNQTVSKEEADWAKAFEKERTLGPVARIEALADIRQYPVINKETGELEYRSARDINANKGIFAPAGPGMQVMSREAIFQDIYFNVDQTKKAIEGLRGQFDTKMRAHLALVLRSADPRSAVGQFITSSAAATLTPDQVDYVTALASLMENAMTLRTIGGMGQGSDELRAAILRAIPGPQTPSKAYAYRQLDLFKGTVDRLHTALPKMMKNQPAGKEGEKKEGVYNPQTGKVEWQ